jgi:AcrR family transcriptional regulator
MGLRAEQAQETRERLVAVAVELFGTKGYEATSIEEVLERAQVSKGALYHHFSSKEALFEAAYIIGCQMCMVGIAQAAMKETDPLEMLRVGCHTWLDMVMDPHIRQVALIDGPAVLGWQRWREIDEQFAFGMTKGAFEHAVQAGSIRADNVDLVAHLAFAMLGEAAMVIVQADDREKARKEAGDAVDRMLAALAMDEPATKGAR